MNDAGGSYLIGRWLFLRLLGLAYFMAFLSFRIQLPGLIGSKGILPAADYLHAMKMNAGAFACWFCPTLAWLNSSDAFLQLLAGAGAGLSLLVVLGIATGPSLAALYALYLSLVSVGGDFTSFQWDAMLLECGFLSMFFAPWSLLEPHWNCQKLCNQNEPSNLILWLLRWLLFRVVFLSGCVKLASGDRAWRDLSALTYHWYTQPLPTPLAWFAEQLPLHIQKCAVIGVFICEIPAPFLIFAPRKWRHFGAALICLFQILIAATGNYCFFNFLTAALCVLLLDDALLAPICPKLLLERLAKYCRRQREKLLFRVLAGLLAVYVVAAGFTWLVGGRFGQALALPEALTGLFSQFCLANSYGVFAVMTTTRDEIVLEGSRDGQDWRAYEFKYKPGDVRRAPPWVAPHQPRLDWQMWFAALGPAQASPWFSNLVYRLLEGSPAVLALLENNPFPGDPPRYVRAVLYNYHFTDQASRKSTGAWWRRNFVGVYFPVSSLDRK